MSNWFWQDCGRIGKLSEEKERNMATLGCKRFTKLHFLKGVGRKLVARFFERFRGELAEKKVDLPKGDLPDDEYFGGLSRLLLSPEGLPGDLCEALFTIDEMADDAGQEGLQNAVAQSKLEVKFEAESSHGDVAMQVWLARPELLAAKHNGQQLRRLSSFEYFGTKLAEKKGKPFAGPWNAAAIEGLRADLDGWFVSHNRGHETTQISYHEIDGEWWFVIRHGDTLLRTAKVERQETTLFQFRPVKDDVVVFSPGHEEIRIQAATEGEKELYRREFGVWLRGDGKYFSERNAFTLEPLRLDGAGALEWKGNGDVDRIVLREFEIAWGGGRDEVPDSEGGGYFFGRSGQGRGSVPRWGQTGEGGVRFLFWGHGQAAQGAGASSEHSQAGPSLRRGGGAKVAVRKTLPGNGNGEECRGGTFCGAYSLRDFAAGGSPNG